MKVMAHLGKRWPLFQEGRAYVADPPWPQWPGSEYQWSTSPWPTGSPPGLPVTGRGMVPVPFEPGQQYLDYFVNTPGGGHTVGWHMVYELTGPTSPPTFTALLLFDDVVQGRTERRSNPISGWNQTLFDLFTGDVWFPAAGAIITPSRSIAFDVVPWTAVPPPITFGPPYFVRRP